MSSSSSLMNFLSDPAQFWEIVEYVGLVGLLFAAVVASVAEYSWIHDIDELRLRWGKTAALVLVVASAIELVATVKTNNISDATIAALQLQTAQANSLAGALGVKEGGLDALVKTKVREIDADANSLKVAAKNANDALNKVSELGRKEDHLGTTLNSDENRLGGNEERIAADESELGDFEEAMIPRLLEQVRVREAMRPFSGVEAYVVSGNAVDAPELASALTSSLESAGIIVKRLALSPLPEMAFITGNFRGIKIEWLGSDKDGEPFVTADKPAAKRLCEVLMDQKIAASVLPEYSPRGSGFWDSRVPKTALFVIVGQKDNDFVKNRRLKELGIIPDPVIKMDDSVFPKMSDIKYDECG